VTCQLPDEDEPHEMLSCKFIVMPGMEINGVESGIEVVPAREAAGGYACFFLSFQCQFSVVTNRKDEKFGLRPGSCFWFLVLSFK